MPFFNLKFDEVLLVAARTEPSVGFGSKECLALGAHTGLLILLYVHSLNFIYNIIVKKVKLVCSLDCISTSSSESSASAHSSS